MITPRGLVKKLVPKKYQPDLFAWLSKRSNGVVMSGPFKGMKYVAQSVGSTFYPKILGTYEIELNPIIESLINRHFQTILNIGAGEGYYSVGFCLKCPGAQVFAFESEESGQRLLAEMARINNVEQRIIVKGHCDIAEFQASLQGATSTLVIMDIEGGEKHLLDPKRIPELAYSHVLVELHDFLYRDISEIVTDRFIETHEITEIWSRERTLADFPDQIPFVYRLAFRKYFRHFMNEWRSEKMRWYYMKPLMDRV